MPHQFDPGTEFPPVSTAEWEAQIARDLKGADYQKRLVWKTDEGIPVRPYYRAEDVTPRDPLANLAGTWQMLPPDREPSLDVDAIVHHDRGATAVQEVAWALAQGADRLAGGLPVSVAGFGIGSHHFMEIAKLRAVRRLWPTVAEAFGRPAHPARPRSDGAREQDALRSVRQPGARHHRGAVGRAGRL